MSEEIYRKALERIAETGGWEVNYVKDLAYPDEPAQPSLSNMAREIAREALEAATKNNPVVENLLSKDPEDATT